jgi:hypothetical protein
MKRFSFFIYRFNGPVMTQLFRHPKNTWKLEQAVISMLAGDLFDTPRYCCDCGCSSWCMPSARCSTFGRWLREHRYRWARRARCLPVAPHRWTRL